MQRQTNKIGLVLKGSEVWDLGRAFILRKHYIKPELQKIYGLDIVFAADVENQQHQIDVLIKFQALMKAFAPANTQVFSLENVLLLRPSI